MTGNKVFIVASYQYEFGYVIEGVFSQRELAEGFIELNKNKIKLDLSIFDYVVDDYLNAK